MESQNIRKCRPLRDWLQQYGYRLPFPRPWYLSRADAEDVMGQVWLNIISGGRLHQEVHLGYLVRAVRNEMTRRGLIQKAEGDAVPAVTRHLHQQHENAVSDLLERVHRRINLSMAERHLEERHLRALELTSEGYTSAEVSEALQKKYGWAVTPATVRKWYERHIRPFYRDQAA
jgi:superfamily II helicase